MTAPSPQTTIAGLRDKVANLRQQHTRALRERDDARDEVVALCAQRLELDAKHAEEIRRHTETAEAAKRGWAKASTEVERLTAERDEARAAIDRVRALHKLVTDHADCPDADTTLGCRCEPNAHAYEYCEYCGTDDECDTIRAINGSGT